jgi:hypothetical protein
MKNIYILGLSFAALSASVHGQSSQEAQVNVAAPANEAAVTNPAPAACCEIPALTPVQIQFQSTINSQANQIGEKFPIKLSMPIELDGKILVPAGTPGVGEIVHAAKSRFGGKAGELILAVRSLDYQGTTIPLRSLRYLDNSKSGQGKDNTGTAAAAAMAVGALSLFITGGEVTIPQGTIAIAKTSAAVTVPPPAQ